MRVLEYPVPPECGGMQVKEFARGYLGFSARAFTAQKYLENGMLRNGESCRSIDVLQAGDVLSFRLAEEAAEYPAVETELSVLFENEDYLAVDKPPGMPVHPSPGHDWDSLLNAVAYHYRQTGQSHAIRPLYRLDRDTSGIVLLGKHRAAVSSAAVQKRYYAVCEGVLSGGGTVDVPIGLKEGSKIVRECGHGERAVTHWRALASQGGHTLLEIRLETGRTHQIRAHFSGLGFPLAGDDLYGGTREAIKRQALHCGRLWLSCRALSINQEFQTDFPAHLRGAFPWLPGWAEICKEESICPHV